MTSNQDDWGGHVHTAEELRRQVEQVCRKLLELYSATGISFSKEELARIVVELVGTTAPSRDEYANRMLGVMAEVGRLLLGDSPYLPYTQFEQALPFSDLGGVDRYIRELFGDSAPFGPGVGRMDTLRMLGLLLKEPTGNQYLRMTMYKKKPPMQLISVQGLNGPGIVTTGNIEILFVNGVAVYSRPAGSGDRWEPILQQQAGHGSSSSE